MKDSDRNPNLRRLQLPPLCVVESSSLDLLDMPGGIESPSVEQLINYRDSRPSHRSQCAGGSGRRTESGDMETLCKCRWQSDWTLARLAGSSRRRRLALRYSYRRRQRESRCRSRRRWGGARWETQPGQGHLRVRRAVSGSRAEWEEV